jgi:hypothetical protein
MSEQWPADPTPARPKLPALEDLPKTADGYDAERVGEAFDAFYRHIAKLDATLQTLEAVEAFSRQAADLRNELRSFRRARWEDGWSQAYGRTAVTASSQRLLPRALPRLVAEVAFLIAVAVILGIRDFSTRTIIATMAVSWLIVGLTEWFVSRERGVTFAAPAEPARQLPPVANTGWNAEASDDEGLTIVAELEPSRASQR